MILVLTVIKAILKEPQINHGLSVKVVFRLSWCWCFRRRAYGYLGT